MVLKLYNTMSRKKEVFKPIDPNGKLVKIYGCGPTVYWTQHIGNLYRETFEDILERVLRFNGYKTNHIRNITDVGHLTSDADEGEDKMVKAIKREKLAMNESSMLKIAEKYTTRFFEDRTKLNLLDADKWPKATEHIEDMIKIVKKMEKKGFTYKTSTGLIFDTSKAKDYEKLGTEPGYCHHCHTGRCPVGVATQDPKLEKRLNPIEAGKRIKNYLTTLTLELQTLARANGKSDVRNLEPEDLAALTVEAAAMARVPLAGTDWIPGKK